MLFELTLIANFIIQHLVMGLGLFLMLTLITKAISIPSEFQNWLWVTAFFLSTLVPFTSFISEEPKQLEQAEISEFSQPTQSTPIKETIAYFKATQSSPARDRDIHWNITGETMYRFTGWAYLFLATWFLGACWRLFFVARTVARSYLLLRFELRHATAINSWGCTGYPVLISDSVKSPMTMGLMKPVILIPRSLVQVLSDVQLNAIILHEVAHLHRKDLWIVSLQEAISIVFWFSPVIRLLNGRINITRELACDMRAAKRLDSGKTYAQSLLDCAQLMLSQKQNVLALGLFSRKKELTHRINEVLNMKYVKVPKALSIIAACAVVSSFSVAFADVYAPKVKVDNVREESDHFTTLSRAKGELLMEAINDSDLDLLHLMINYGLDINSPIMGDGTALMVAVKSDNREMAEYLVALGADVNKSAQGDGNPLIVAALTGNLDMAQYLLDQGANINAVVEGDETPLINAVRENHMRMTRFLVENGADVNLGVNVLRPDGSTAYWTPLNQATASEVKQYLMQNGAY